MKNQFWHHEMIYLYITLILDSSKNEWNWEDYFNERNRKEKQLIMIPHHHLYGE